MKARTVLFAGSASLIALGFGCSTHQPTHVALPAVVCTAPDVVQEGQPVNCVGGSGKGTDNRVVMAAPSANDPVTNSRCLKAYGGAVVSYTDTAGAFQVLCVYVDAQAYMDEISA